MAPPLSSLYTTTFLLALLITLCVGATLRLLAILPRGKFQPKPFRRRPTATRVLIVLGSGGHTHEMFYLLRNLDTRKYTHRTYVISSGDAFSAGRAVEFEKELEAREKLREREEEERRMAEQGEESGINEERREKDGNTTTMRNRRKSNASKQANSSQEKEEGQEETRISHTGPSSYNLVHLPRARNIHQPLYTTPLTSLATLLSSFRPLLSTPPLLPGQPPQNRYEAAARDLPDLIITNGPATGVIVVLAAMILRFFNWRSAESRGKCRTVYVESFARVTRLSLSGRLLLNVVDRFLVQWEGLEGVGGDRKSVV